MTSANLELSLLPQYTRLPTFQHTPYMEECHEQLEK